MDKYRLNIFTRRWGHDDTYTIEFTDTGWIFNGVMIPNSGPCDPKGVPYLYQTLDHDSVNYPEALGEYLEYLWYKINEGELQSSEIQHSLNVLCDWINICEKSSPIEGVWDHFK